MTAHRFALAAHLDREIERLRQEHARNPGQLSEALSKLLLDSFVMALAEVEEA